MALLLCLCLCLASSAARVATPRGDVALADGDFAPRAALARLHQRLLLLEEDVEEEEDDSNMEDEDYEGDEEGEDGAVDEDGKPKETIAQASDRTLFFAAATINNVDSPTFTCIVLFPPMIETLMGVLNHSGADSGRSPERRVQGRGGEAGRRG
jgi:hypothetical protein